MNKMIVRFPDGEEIVIVNPSNIFTNLPDPNSDYVIDVVCDDDEQPKGDE